MSIQHIFIFFVSKFSIFSERSYRTIQSSIKRLFIFAVSNIDIEKICTANKKMFNSSEKIGWSFLQIYMFLDITNWFIVFFVQPKLAFENMVIFFKTFDMLYKNHSLVMSINKRCICLVKLNMLTPWRCLNTNLSASNFSVYD